ncbi:MAG TPA: carbohydrate binding domain-containing protein [Kiritimatiellia bacterium]|jgi:hypothetical protein
MGSKQLAIWTGAALIALAPARRSEAAPVNTWFEGFETSVDTAELAKAWPADAKDDGVPALATRKLVADRVLAGNNCLQFAYTLNNNPSGANMDRIVHVFDSNQDWSEFDTFTFYYKGQPGNSRDQVYFELRDEYGGTLGRAQLPKDSTRITSWTLAEIDITGFANLANNTSLTGVRSIVIGVNAGDDYGTGTIYFDNLGSQGAADHRAAAQGGGAP